MREPKPENAEARGVRREGERTEWSEWTQGLQKPGRHRNQRAANPGSKGETLQTLNQLKQIWAANAIPPMPGGGWVRVRAHTKIAPAKCGSDNSE